MDFTSLQQMTRLCQFLGFLNNAASTNPEMDIFAKILEPENIGKGSMVQQIDEFEEAKFLYNAPPLNTTHYHLILQYLNLRGHHGQWRHFTDLPHPPHALILPPNAKQCTSFHEDSLNRVTYSCNSSHKGNSFIEFYDIGIQGHRTGVIQYIFEIPLQGFLRKFIFVSPYCELSEAAQANTPYVQPRLRSKIVEVAPSNDILVIEPEHIITHLTTYETRGDIYRIPRNVLVVCWALDRGRKEYVPTT